MNAVTQVKRTLQALLEDRLPAMLQQGDSEADDGVTTPPPAEFHRTDVQGLGAFPAIELLASPSVPQGNSYAQILRHRVMVGVTLVGDDEETLTVQVERYVWAIRRVARDTALAPGCPTGPIDTGKEAYTPMVKRDVEIPFVKGGWIELFIDTVE